ncbi:MAG: MetQ/NlpA family ABC transporter substrate-binding protein [Trueperella sp.]|nr:MetQ/NlpA family ABC transporter substrate-binding protein [Trueperella sp.]
MRKLIALAAAATLALAGCAGNADEDLNKLVVGASPVPHAVILEYVAENLAADAGIELEIKEYTDYVQPNVALNAGEIDANFFQHLPYLEEEIAKKNYDLDHGRSIHIEPFGLYSEKITDLADLKNGAVVVVTNDPSNQARGLKLLEAQGLIKLADVPSPTLYDIAENPKNLDIRESEAPAIPVQLPDVDLAVINGNFALEASLVPAKDALALESGADNPYSNILVWNKNTKKLDAILKLDALLRSPEVAKFLQETYPNGEIIPAF